MAVITPLYDEPDEATVEVAEKELRAVVVALAQAAKLLADIQASGATPMWQRAIEPVEERIADAMKADAVEWVRVNRGDWVGP